MGGDKDNIETMVPYTFNDDTPNNENPNDDTPNGDTPNDKNPNEDTSDITNDSKATIPGTSSNQGRKVIINPTDDEILAAQGLLQLFQEARVFSTPKMPKYPASININSRLLSGAGRSEFPSYPFFKSYIPTTDQVGTGNSSVVGGVDKSQNDANKGSVSRAYPSICPYSTLTNIEEVKGTATTSVLSPSLLPPFSPYSTLAIKEEVNDTASTMKSKKAKESEKKHYLNRNSKKRKADESYMKKKVEVHQKMELYKDNY